MLIADDEPSIRRVLEAIFTKDGYTVHIAENGRKALEVAGQQPIKVLITDLIMPDMNGVDLLKKVLLQRPDVVVVMVTAYGTINTAVEAIRYGASDYITKPFDVDEIRAIVARAVQSKSEDASGNGAASGSPAARTSSSKGISIGNRLASCLPSSYRISSVRWRKVSAPPSMCR